jgi:hypothetical protein
MGHTRDEVTQNLAARWWWEVARRDEARGARRLYRKPLGDGVYRRDEGALLDDCFHSLQAIGVMALREEAHGAALQRQRVPFVPAVLRYGVKTRCGIERIKALPSLLCSDEAVMQVGGFHAPQVRQGLCPRGATTRPGERAPGPIGPDTLAKHSGRGKGRELEAVCNEAMRALATAGRCGVKVTGRAEGPALEPTPRATGCGPVTRTVRREEKRGQGHAIEVTVYGWKVLRWIEAVTTMPLAVNLGQMQAHEALWTRAVVRPARMHLAGDARLPKVGFAQGCLDGSMLWWLDQHAITCVGPAQTKMAVAVEARAQAAGGEGLTLGRRVDTVRHGPGRAAWTERLDTAVVGLTALTP